MVPSIKTPEGAAPVDTVSDFEIVHMYRKTHVKGRREQRDLLWQHLSRPRPGMFLGDLDEVFRADDRFYADAPHTLPAMLKSAQIEAWMTLFTTKGCGAPRGWGA